ncbi:hypothetical protein OHB26_15705 [Nocardia sp. NBC_01503]|uniref:hypothetical protein n=1 Tax=Nocardia sp. NBC_01503 TaxID=2975997 RepID=UPI002E7C46B4|nr:hypothetical protein [Nocardia sp. NBC_01503]WTL35507.1 hypothetical protein OHB26_15705 [Nocardia sp. NBC_01503]
MFDSYDSAEDPELAQARVFLAELEKHAATLVRRLQSGATLDVRRSLDAELAAVHRYADRIHRRFPGIAVHPLPGTPSGSPPP